MTHKAKTDLIQAIVEEAVNDIMELEDIVIVEGEESTASWVLRRIKEMKEDVELLGD